MRRFDVYSVLGKITVIIITATGSTDTAKPVREEASRATTAIHLETTMVRPT